MALRMSSSLPAQRPAQLPGPRRIPRIGGGPARRRPGKTERHQRALRRPVQRVQRHPAPRVATAPPQLTRWPARPSGGQLLQGGGQLQAQPIRRSCHESNSAASSRLKPARKLPCRCPRLSQARHTILAKVVVRMPVGGDPVRASWKRPTSIRRPGSAAGRSDPPRHQANPYRAWRPTRPAAARLGASARDPNRARAASPARPG